MTAGQWLQYSILYILNSYLTDSCSI